MKLVSEEKPKYADGKDPDSLVELREAVQRFREMEQLIPSPPRITEDIKPYRRHQMPCGTSLEFPLDEDDKASCSLFFLSNATEYPHHSHAQREWLIVKQGSLFFQKQIDGEWELPERITVGQSVTIEPGIIHRANTIEDTWFYAITVPKADW